MAATNPAANWFLKVGNQVHGSVPPDEPGAKARRAQGHLPNLPSLRKKKTMPR
jgi:hypothetical protein